MWSPHLLSLLLALFLNICTLNVAESTVSGSISIVLSTEDTSSYNSLTDAYLRIVVSSSSNHTISLSADLSTTKIRSIYECEMVEDPYTSMNVEFFGNVVVFPPFLVHAAPTELRCPIAPPLRNNYAFPIYLSYTTDDSDDSYLLATNSTPVAVQSSSSSWVHSLTVFSIDGESPDFISSEQLRLLLSLYAKAMSNDWQSFVRDVRVVSVSPRGTVPEDGAAYRGSAIEIVLEVRHHPDVIARHIRGKKSVESWMRGAGMPALLGPPLRRIHPTGCSNSCGRGCLECRAWGGCAVDEDCLSGRCSPLQRCVALPSRTSNASSRCSGNVLWMVGMVFLFYIIGIVT